MTYSKTFVGFGWIESFDFYVTVEQDKGDETGWVDSDLYAAWRTARATYEALAAQIEDELVNTRPTT